MTNVIKFQAPFERIKLHNEAYPEIGLRKAIILQAIIDASNISPTLQSKKLELDAKEWLFNNNENFEKTCYEAGFEPDYIRKIARKLIKLHAMKNMDENISNQIKSTIDSIVA